MFDTETKAHCPINQFNKSELYFNSSLYSRGSDTITHPVTLICAYDLHTIAAPLSPYRVSGDNDGQRGSNIRYSNLELSASLYVVCLSTSHISCSSEF